MLKITSLFDFLLFLQVTHACQYEFNTLIRHPVFLLGKSAIFVVAENLYTHSHPSPG